MSVAASPVERHSRTAGRERNKTRLQERILAHLWANFPLHCVILTDAQTRNAADVAIERAARRGFQSAADVCSYVNLMMFLGSHFDEDPQLPWAGAALRDSAGAPRTAAMERLYALTTTELTKVIGTGGEPYRRALIRSRSKTFETLKEEYGADEDAIRRWLRDLYREKYDALSGQTLSRTIQLADYFATRYALAKPVGALVYAGLIFLLGSAIDRDPFHPWAGEVLRDDSLADPMAKAQRLHQQAIAQLERYMALERLTRKE